MVHEGRWQLIKTDDGKMLAIPPQLNLHQQLARESDIASRVLRR
jgi:hypothetical protein